MKKLLSIIMVIVLFVPKTQAVLSQNEKAIVTLKDNTCQNIQEKDIPTILIPGILASWYSEEGYKESGNSVKRWIADPITHAYDTLIYTFKQNGYKIKDVFYKDQFTLYLDGTNPKGGLYVFGYDWKKDNKITATLLTQLIGLILKDYEIQNKCNIGKVNIVAHSMGGLVARAMLEDMCVESQYPNGLMKIVIRDDYNKSYYFNDKNLANGKIQKFDSYPCKNPYASNTISKSIKVNKLVTISTPQRGSPKAFAIWEKGDIEMTEGFALGFALKYAIGGIMDDEGFYNYIHGYEKSIPNGIVTIGQLLPDIQNNNDYNSEKLKYLYYENKANVNTESNSLNNIYDIDQSKYENLIDSAKKFSQIKLENHPQNSFLEELNKTENINKMFDKISNKYYSYYSTVTGYKDKNNILNFELGDKYITKPAIIGPSIIETVYDETYKYNGLDIYNKYNENIGNNYYLISKLWRNNTGLGGDGTVPTNNLKLVPNDSIDGKEINNPKFESKFIDCSQVTYKGFGNVTTNEACAHANMPFATSAKVVDFLAGTYNNTNNERKVLIENFGYASYIFMHYIRSSFSTYSKVYNGIHSGSTINIFFDNDYYTKKNINIDKSIDSSFSLDLPGGALEKTNSFILYDILSPIDIMITDEQGRRIGIDRDTGMIINEIPGAWTSGRAGESGEREFFLIPAIKGEKVDHRIETNSTGNGEYHIVMTSLDDKGNITNSGITIAGNAKLGFNENYEVVATSTGSKYIDLDVNLPLTLEVTKEFKTLDDKIDIRYNVKGKGREKVSKIRYRLENSSTIQGRFPSSREGQPVNNTGTVQNGEEKIDGILEIPLKDIGNYELVLELLDKNGETLKTETVKIEKGEQKKDIKTTKNILNAMFYKDIDLSLYDTGSGIIDTNYKFKITYDQNKQNINILKPNGEVTKFSIDPNFRYKSTENSNLEIQEVNPNNIIFKETLTDLGVEKIYNYNLLQDRIEKVEIVKGKLKQELMINYDINGNIREIISDNNAIKFVYDEYTGKLKSISDKYDNIIEFNYEDNELVDVKMNNQLVNQDLELFRLDYKTIFDIKHKNNLQKIKTKLQSQKLDEKKKQKLIKSLDKSKEKYLKLAKYDITKKEIEYLVEEIKKILENL